MSLTTHIVVTSMLAMLAVMLIATACLLDNRCLAWCGFGFGIIAQGSFHDCRLRWAVACRKYDARQELRAVR